MLFLIFINNLLNVLSSQQGIYAGDTSSYSCLSKSKRSKIVKLAAALKNDLQSVVKWGEKLFVKFNASKMKLPSFNHPREAFLTSISMADANLQKSDTLRFLRLTFPADMK